MWNYFNEKLLSSFSRKFTIKYLSTREIALGFIKSSGSHWKAGTVIRRYGEIRSDTTPVGRSNMKYSPLNYSHISPTFLYVFVSTFRSSSSLSTSKRIYRYSLFSLLLHLLRLQILKNKQVICSLKHHLFMFYYPHRIAFLLLSIHILKVYILKFSWLEEFIDTTRLYATKRLEEYVIKSASEMLFVSLI